MYTQTHTYTCMLAFILAVFRFYFFSCFRSHGGFVMDILSLQCANKTLSLYNVVIYLLIRVGINEKIYFNGHIIYCM